MRVAIILFMIGMCMIIPAIWSSFNEDGPGNIGPVGFYDIFGFQIAKSGIGPIYYESAFTVIGAVSVIPLIGSVIFLRCKSLELTFFLIATCLGFVFFSVPDLFNPQYGLSEATEFTWGQTALSLSIIFISGYALMLLMGRRHGPR